jgi:1-phosphatidylinositol-4-phosphate 5-kinase
VIDNIEIPDKKDWDVAEVNTQIEMRKLSVSSRKTADKRAAESKLVINEDIQVTEYAPDVFAFLRQKDGYDNSVLRDSLHPEANKKMVFKAGEGSGKSGSFFFFSQDQKFIIKTMTEGDFLAFKRIQKKYFQLVSENEDSLLARIYGIYSVRMEDQSPVKLVVMGNALSGATGHVGIYDLKGSMVSRIVKGKYKPTATIKDQNLLLDTQRKTLLRFKASDRRAVMKAMERDVRMLKKFNMMDYSLLFCIQNNPRYQELKEAGTPVAEINERVQGEFEGNRHSFISECGRYIYRVSIIDYLQDYNTSKKLEYFGKVYVLL